MGELLIVILIVAVIVLFILFAAIKIVREYERLVVFRLGRAVGVRGPGLVILIPIIERADRVDLREQVVPIGSQNTITKDNVNIQVDLLIYYRVFDSMSSVVEVADFAAAAQGMAMTTLRAVIGETTLDEALSQRERLNQELRIKLDDVTARWGVKVTAVEIREIDPPRDIQESMNRQMTAERNRRAMVTESEGQRAAAIEVAEGDRRSNVLRAQGDRESQLLRAEGYSRALRTIFEAAREIDSNTLTLQYLEALKEIGASDSTKFILPLELTELIRPLSAAITRNPGSES
jgi:regulator of protease activity HflC (stomatin/prohibitin superfamily)